MKINPENESTWYNKACAESLMDKKSEALVYLKCAIELDPSYTPSNDSKIVTFIKFDSITISL